MKRTPRNDPEPVLTVTEAAMDFVRKASASDRYGKAVEAEAAQSMADFNAPIERAWRAAMEKKRSLENGAVFQRPVARRVFSSAESAERRRPPSAVLRILRSGQ